MDRPPSNAKKPRRPLWRRTLGALGWAATVVVGLIAAALLGFFGVASLRQAALERVLGELERSLPGRLEHGRVLWTRPDEVRLEGVHWHGDRGDTLARVDRLELGIDFRALFARRVHVPLLAFHGVAIDVPAMQTTWAEAAAGREPEAPRESDGPRSVPFFRPGYVESLPAIAVDRFEMTIDEIRLGPALRLAGTVGLRADLTDGSDATVEVRPLDLTVRRDGGAIFPARVTGSMDAALVAGRFEAELDIAAPGEWSARLEVLPAGADRVKLRLSDSMGEPSRPTQPEGRPGGTRSTSSVELELDVALNRDRTRLDGISAAGRLQVPALRELERRPFLPPLADIPEPGPFHADLSARADLAPPRAGASIAIGKSALWDSLVAEGRYGDGQWSIEDLVLLASDARLELAASGHADSVLADARVLLRGADFLDAWLPEPPDIGSLDAELVARARGSLNAPAIEASINGSGVVAGVPIRELLVEASTARIGVEPMPIRLSGRVQDLWVGLDGSVEARFTGAALGPIRLLERKAARGSGGPEPFTGHVAWSRGVELRDLAVTGDFGSARIEATVDSSARVAGAIHARWAELPRALLSRLELGAGPADSLRRAWRAAGPFHVDARLRSGKESVEAAGTFRLPGPRAWEPLLPDSARLDRTGPLVGAFQAEGPSWQELSLDLTAEGEAWLDSLRARARIAGERREIDVLRLALLGARVDARGSVADSVELRGTVALSSLDGARRLGLLPDSIEATADGQFHVHGPLDQVGVVFDATGAVVLPDVVVPRYSLRGSRNEEPLAVALELPEGARLGALAFEHVEVDFRAETDSLFPAQVRARADSPDLAFRSALRLGRRGEAWTAEADSLSLRARGGELSNRGSFSVRIDPIARRYAIEDLELEGTIGEIRADGFLEPGNADLEIRASLDLPPLPEAAPVPPGLWPKQVEADVRASGERLDVAARALGIALESEREADLWASLRSQDDGIFLEAAVVSLGDSLLAVSGSVPGILKLYPPELRVVAGDLGLRLEARDLPVPIPAVRADARQERMMLNASGSITGTSSRPRLDLEIRGNFPEWEAMSRYEIAGRTRMEATSDRTGPLVGRVALARVASPGSPRSDSLLVASAELPVRWTWNPFSVSIDENESVRAQIDSRDLALEDLSPFLPGDVSATGRLELGIDLQGPFRDPALEGTLAANGLGMRLADGTRATADADLRFAGSALRPRVRGAVEVESGLLVVPEARKAMLPVEGEARLWQTSRGDSAAESGDAGPGGTNGESAGAAAQDQRDDGTGAAGRNATLLDGADRGASIDGAPLVRPDLDVTVDIPGAVWIRGRGLEVELEGNVRITYEEAPILTGTLQARSGHLRLLGRYFQVESGIVGFYGDEDIDPNLDLTLSAKVDETTVRVDVSGTAKQPVLQLTSDPEMEEADILSLLLLGRPLEELDDDQVDLLERRAADLAASFGATQLGSTLSGQLGIDLVSVQQTSQGTGSALVIGKYLSPRILLKYEQALQSSADFLVNLEYLLTRRLRLETLYGKQSQSGAELNWISEY